MGPTIRHFIQSWYNFHTSAASDKYHLWVGQVAPFGVEANSVFATFCIFYQLKFYQPSSSPSSQFSQMKLLWNKIQMFSIFSGLKNRLGHYESRSVWVEICMFYSPTATLQNPDEPWWGAARQGGCCHLSHRKNDEKKEATTFVWIGNKNIYSRHCQGVKVG